jgi:hypothetical protein
MDIVQLVRCALGYHRRDRSSVVVGSPFHHGRCRGCRTAMVKGPGGWKREKRAI